MDKDQALEKHGKIYERDTILFREGDAVSKLWVINEGRIRLSKRVFNDEIVLEYLGPGEFCGELAIVTDGLQPVSATVEEPARLLVIDAKQFETMVRNNGELAMRMLRKLSGRLTEAQFRISTLQMRNNTGRVMLQLRWEVEHSDSPKTLIPINLAPSLGLDSAEVEIILDKLVAKNLIKLPNDGSFSIVESEEYDRYLRYLELHDRYAFFDKF